jgi:hypothetical protein
MHALVQTFAASPLPSNNPNPLSIYTLMLLRFAMPLSFQVSWRGLVLAGSLRRIFVYKITGGSASAATAAQA